MSNDNFDPRLKPCPLCGGKAFLGFYVDGVDNFVYCSDCYFGKDNLDGEQDTIDKWNRRVSPIPIKSVPAISLNIEKEYWDLKADGIDIDGLCNRVQALIDKEKKKMMSTKIKDMVKNKMVEFQFYRDGDLWYKTECGFQFPVPISDTKGALFLRTEKAILLMRYIRKHLELIDTELLKQEEAMGA